MLKKRHYMSYDVEHFYHLIRETDNLSKKPEVKVEDARVVAYHKARIKQVEDLIDEIEDTKDGGYYIEYWMPPKEEQIKRLEFEIDYHLDKIKKTLGIDRFWFDTREYEREVEKFD